MSKRTPNQAMADTMAYWKLPDAEAKRVDKAYQEFYGEQKRKRDNNKTDRINTEGDA